MLFDIRVHMIVSILLSIELLNNEGKARRMGISGRERVEKYFNIELMVEKYENVYDELVHSGTE